MYQNKIYHHETPTIISLTHSKRTFLSTKRTKKKRTRNICSTYNKSLYSCTICAILYRIFLCLKHFESAFRLFFLLFCSFNESFDIFLSFDASDHSTNNGFSPLQLSTTFVELIISWIGHHSYQKTSLTLSQLGCRSSEIILSCLLYSIDTVSKFYNIEIDFHDPFLTSSQLNQYCKIRFQSLSDNRTSWSKKNIFCCLLRYCTSSKTK